MEGSIPRSIDPLIVRALALLHADPARHWTLARIAAEAGASRSSLAERFTASIGWPPIEYLTRWRMQLAAEMLSDRSLKIAVVAQNVGYGSEAAFSRAFKRVRGCSPNRWRSRISTCLFVGCSEFEPDKQCERCNYGRQHRYESTGIHYVLRPSFSCSRTIPVLRRV